MSSGGAMVRFADGTVKVTEYHGTSDVLCPVLSYSWGDHDERDHTKDWSVTCDAAFHERALEPVTIWTNYGGGFWWEGLATRERVDADSCTPFGAEGWNGEVLFPTIPTHDGTPDWVTAQEAVTA